MSQRMKYYNRILQEKPVYSRIAELVLADYENVNLARHQMQQQYQQQTQQCRTQQQSQPQTQQQCQTQQQKNELYVMVLAPVLVEYVSWVLDEACHRGIKRLYFLARDGYQMYLAAQNLCRIKNIPVECRYLKVSRYAMRLPEYHLLGEKCLEHICIGGIDVTFERIMKRAGLSDEEARETARRMSHDADYRRILHYKEVIQLKEELRQQPLFFEDIYRHSRQEYQPAIKYLQQEGLFETISYALVDSGWVGTLQKTISHLVGKEKLEGFYFGMYEMPEGADAACYHSFFFGANWGLRRKVHFSNCLFEAIFTSPEGMTLRYEERNGTWFAVPDFHENPNKEQLLATDKLLQQYLSIYEQAYEKKGTGIINEKTTEAVGKRIGEKTNRRKNESVKKRIGEKTNRRKNESARKKADAKFVEKLLSRFMGRPTELEVTAYGNLLFSDDVLEGNLKKVAADLTAEEIRGQRFVNKAMIMLGFRKGEIHESAWLEGSIIKEGSHVRTALRHAALYKYFIYLRKIIWK